MNSFNKYLGDDVGVLRVFVSVNSSLHQHNSVQSESSLLI